VRYLVLVAIVSAMLVACAPASKKREADRSAAESQSLSRARVHTDLGGAYYESGQYGVALEELNEAIAADSRYAPAYNSLGLVYMALREEKKAKESFERSLRLDAEDSSANNNYGLLLCQTKREKEGIRHFLIALKNPLYEKSDSALANAGVCARRMGDDKAADDFLSKAITLRPNNGVALFNLAQLKYDTGNFDAARGLLKRHLQNSSPQADSLWLGARIEHKLGDVVARASYGAQLKNRFPDSAESRMFEAGKF
jgi:type IV pilus assembly protein PilF